MEFFDMHVHSTFSCDGEASMEEMCAAAEQKGVTKIAFTEHWDVVPDSEGEAHYMERESEIPGVFERLRKMYEGRLELLRGIELGQPMHNWDQAERFLQKHSFDFILGSVHFYRDKQGCIQDVYYVDYNVVSPRTMFEDYFADMLRMIQLGCFDVLAHLDYPVRVLEGYISGPSLKDFKDLVEPVLRKAAENGIGMEISTRGLCDWQHRVGPEVWILKRFRELGGEFITLGSDAHRRTQLGYGMQEACKAAVEAGFSKIYYYRNRKPHGISIDL